MSYPDSNWAIPVGTAATTYATLSNQYFSTTVAHSADLLPWFKKQWDEWNRAAGSADRYAQFGVRCSQEAHTGGTGQGYGRAYYRTGESTNSVKTSLTVTCFAP